METTETYLNLNSEQFSSWLNEFDAKYKNVEKNLLTSEENMSEKDVKKNSVEEVESDSEQEIESESNNSDNKDSDIFIKKNISETPDFYSDNSSSRILLNRKILVKKPKADNNLDSSERKSEIISESKNEKKYKEIKEIKVETIKEEIILSLSELDNLIPKMDNKPIKENQKKDELNKKDEGKKLSGVALYKLISRRKS